MFVSFARKDNGTGPENAYDRQFTKLNLTALFSEPAPTSTSQLIADM